jgi:N-acetylglucosaminyldiphosphoundecaprenol N-acetyl-beta-D-mannosaminyltransferase
MPLVALCRLAGVAALREHRVTLNDFIWPLLTLAANEGWRVFYVGSDSAVSRAGSAEIRRRLPHIRLESHHGFFQTQHEGAEAARAVAAFRPQLVLVGMGMGRQERWILQNLHTLAPACVVTVGACMEYIAGAVRTPPRWMGRAGCEWLFRLAENPSRFWYRYCVEPWFVLAYLVWYSSLKDAERSASRLEEFPSFARDGREAELRETA